MHFKNISTSVFCLLSGLTAPLISVHEFRKEIFLTLRSPLGQQLLLVTLCPIHAYT